MEVFLIMEEFSKRTWAQIDLDALEYNFKSIESKLKKVTKVLCVLKADAYGHGAERVAEKFPDCDVDIHFGGQPIYYYIVSLE